MNADTPATNGHRASPDGRPADLRICGGWVVTDAADGAGTMQPRDVLIRDGRIHAVVAHDAQHLGTADAIDAREMIVAPGFIDTHRHLWQTALRGLGADLTAPEYRSAIRAVFGQHVTPEDVYASTLAGVLEALDGGITTILDWAHIMNSPGHADASIAALRASGARAVFAYGAPNDHQAERWWSDSERGHPPDVRRVRSQVLTDDAALVTMAFAARAPHLVRAEVMVHDWQLARELGLRITVDGGLGGGMWSRRRSYPIRLLRDAGLLGSDTTYVHCNNLAPDEYQAIADSGGSVSMSPCAEMHVGHGIPATRSLLAHGIRPSLSIDYVTQVAGDMFGAMRSVLATDRGIQSRAAFEQGRGVDPWRLRTRDVFAFATSCGAAALGKSHRIGQIVEGGEADIVLVSGRSVRLSPVNDPLASLVLLATPADVDTVIVAGKVVKRAGRMVRLDLEAARQAVVASRDRLFAAAGQAVGPLLAAPAIGNWNW